MNSTFHEPEQWQACPPGELSRLSGRLRRRHFLHVASRAAAVAAALLVAIGFASWQFGKPASLPELKPGEGFDYGGITCAGVHRVLPQLKAGTLDSATLARVREHLDKCDHCQPISRFLPAAAHPPAEQPLDTNRRALSPRVFAVPATVRPTGNGKV